MKNLFKRPWVKYLASLLVFDALAIASLATPFGMGHILLVGVFTYLVAVIFGFAFLREEMPWGLIFLMAFINVALFELGMVLFLQSAIREATLMAYLWWVLGH